MLVLIHSQAQYREVDHQAIIRLSITCRNLLTLMPKLVVATMTEMVVVTGGRGGGAGGRDADDGGGAAGDDAADGCGDGNGSWRLRS